MKTYRFLFCSESSKKHGFLLCFFLMNQLVFEGLPMRSKRDMWKFGVFTKQQIPSKDECEFVNASERASKERGKGKTRQAGRECIINVAKNVT